MLKLLRYLRRKDWLYALCGVVFIVAQVWLDLKMPEFMNAITRISQGAVDSGGTLADIWKNGGLMLLCTLGSVVCSVITSFFVVTIAADFSARLREALYTKVQSFSLSEINRFSTASLITRSTNDVQQVQMIIAMGLQMAVKAPLTAVWAIGKIAGGQWQWTAVIAAAVVLLVLGIVIVTRLVTKKFELLQKLTDSLNQVTRENLTGIRVVRAYNAEGFQEQKFEAVNQEFTATNLFTGRVMAVLSPLMSLVMSCISLSIYWIGAALINGASLQEFAGLFGDMVVFMSYGMQILSSFLMVAMIFMFAPRALVSARRIDEVLQTEPSILDGPGAGETPERGTVEFQNVSFRYPDGGEEVLREISFKAERGQTVAFIGSTGCGKSTLVNLVPRFYDVTSGRVLVDGVDVRTYKKDELLKKIGYVSQKAVLFSGDIRSNVAFGDNAAEDDRVRRAIATAQSTDFVEGEKGGIGGTVAQNGSNFSGGQKQRLSIARALDRNAELYIFDDTFSALDYKTDRTLRQALREEMAGATCLIVAQRVGTIMDADQILVLEDGRIVGRGTHRELLDSCETYREIARSQLSEEELAS